MSTQPIALAETAPQRTRISLRWLLLLGAFLLLWRLDYAPFWNPDEGRYASSSREMAGMMAGQPSDWVVPHLNTIPRLNKPPLVYWLAASSFRAFGPSEWAGRLVPALAAIGVMLLLWGMGRTMFGERAGIIGAMVWATSLLSFGMARVLSTDMLLTASIALAMYGIWNALESSDNASTKYKFCAVAGVGMGLALLAKGPVGVALPLAIGLIYIAVARRWDCVPWFGVVAALLLALLIATPWYAAVHARDPNFLQHFLGEENLKRFSGSQEFHEKTSPFFYVPVVLAGLLPWTPFLVIAVARWRHTENDSGRRARLFLWLWGGLIVLFFSLSSTKLISYVVPAFPAFTLLLGEAASTLFEGRKTQEKRVRRLEWVPLGLTITLNIILMVVARKALTSGKSLPSEAGSHYAMLLGGILLVGTGLLAWAWRSRDALRVSLVQVATMAALILCGLPLAGQIAKYEDSSALMKALAPRLETDDVIVQSTFQPSAMFYAARPITVARYKNTSGLDEAALQRSPLFPNVNANRRPQGDAVEHLDVDGSRGVRAVAQFLHQPRRTFAMLRQGEMKQLLSLMPAAHLAARNNDFCIVSNRPAPSGFAFDYVTRRKASLDKASLDKASRDRDES
ncbi:MAG TPA: glycosyltransferase family 39 protein [Abditibacteriaceae bacterium]